MLSIRMLDKCLNLNVGSKHEIRSSARRRMVGEVGIVGKWIKWDKVRPEGIWGSANGGIGWKWTTVQLFVCCLSRMPTFCLIFALPLILPYLVSQILLAYLFSLLCDFLNKVWKLKIWGPEVKGGSEGGGKPLEKAQNFKKSAKMKNSYFPYFPYPNTHIRARETFLLFILLFFHHWLLLLILLLPPKSFLFVLRIIDIFYGYLSVSVLYVESRIYVFCIYMIMCLCVMSTYCVYVSMYFYVFRS